MSFFIIFNTDLKKKALITINIKQKSQYLIKYCHFYYEKTPEKLKNIHKMTFPAK